MPEPQPSAWSKATGISRGRSRLQQTLGDILMGGVDVLTGALGIPTGIDSKGVTIGELLTAGVPVGAIVRGGGKAARTLVNGMYSRLDEAAAMLPKKGVQASGVMNWLQKSPEGINPEEAAWRKVPQFLQSHGNQVVTPEALAAHLKANPAPFPQVKTLGGPKVPELSPADIDARFVQSEVPPGHNPDVYPGYWEAYDRRTGSLITRGPSEAEVRRQSLVFGPRENLKTTKFDRYQVPGGDDYRETLQTLPDTTGAQLDARRREIEALGRDATSAQKQEWADIMNQLKPDNRDVEGISKFAGRPEFRSSHYSDDPNILVHTRSNDRTLPTGERGRFVEEVQSDWHQEGKKKGYAAPVTELPEGFSAKKEKWQQGWIVSGPDGRPYSGEKATREEAIAAALSNLSSSGKVPNAPFKESWPDLGFKQQLIEAANDPQAEWIGFTGGKTQANRYDLSKSISEVHYSGTNLKAYDLDGNEVISRGGVTAQELPDYIGKEAAEKLMAQPQRGTLRSLEGVQLQVGGEGMHQFYDKLLPKRAEKVLKPFGGKVEPVAFNDFGEPGKYPSWMARLTPEMKEAIKRGVPLMSVIGAAGGASIGQLLGLSGQPQKGQ